MATDNKEFNKEREDAGWNAYFALQDRLKEQVPNPRNVKFQRIVDQYNNLDDCTNPQRGTVRYAWNGFKQASGELRVAIGHWIRTIPCRMWWHSIPKGHSIYHGIKICRRCGAWRER